MSPVRHGLHSSVLPQTGLDILLVGPTNLCQPLGESLLLLHERKTPPKSDVAVEALRSYLEDTKRIRKLRRHVHMVEKVENISDCQSRMDHIVLVVSQSNVEESKNCIKDAAKYLDDDYALLQRLSIVVIIDSKHDYRNTQWETFLTSLRSGGSNTTSSSGGKRKRSQKQQPKLFPSPVPVFQYRNYSNSNASSSLTERRAVSKMIMERAKAGIRETPFPSSPLVFTL